jgi:hypothetical protein
VDSSVWPFVFLALVLKIPLIWVGVIVYRAIKDVPDPEEGFEVVDPRHGPGRDPRRFRPGPLRGGPQRRYARRGRSAPARADVGER